MSRDLHIFTNCNNSEIKSDSNSQVFFFFSTFTAARGSTCGRFHNRLIRLIAVRAWSLPRWESRKDKVCHELHHCWPKSKKTETAENDIDNLSWNNEQRRTKFYVNSRSKSLKSETEIFHANFRFENCTRWRQPHVKLSSSCRIDFHSRLFRNSSRFGLTTSS